MKETKWTKYYGDFVKAPDMKVNKTIYWAFKDAALQNSNKTAFEYFSLKCAYSEFLAEIDKCASAFTKLGVKAGDTVTISSAGLPQPLICIYALSKIGAISSIVSLDSLYTGLIDPIKKTDSSVVVMTVNDFNHSFEALKRTNVKKVILCRYSDYSNTYNKWDPFLWSFEKLDLLEVYNSDIEGQFKTLSWGSFIRMTGQVQEFSDCKATALYYHGGTANSEFNAVTFTSEALNNMARLCTSLYGKEHHRVLSFARLAFSFGFSFSAHSVFLSGNTYLINVNRTTDFPTTVLNRYLPDTVIGYPQQLESFKSNRKISKKAYRTIKTVFAAATYMSSLSYRDLTESFSRHGSNADIIRVYGTTEACSACAFNPPHLDNDRILGIPIPGVRMRIINQVTGVDAIPGEIGLIAVNTPALMKGYFGNESETRKLISKHKDGRYWILTGDLGHEDDDGIFYYDGSERRLFDKGGIHVYPQLIENEIKTVLGVNECCVIPVGEGDRRRIKAIIQPEPDYLFDNDKLLTLQNEVESMNELELVEEMRPDEYEFVAYLPMTSTGKVDYNKLIDIYKGDRDEQVSQNDFDDDFDFSDGI